MGQQRRRARRRDFTVAVALGLGIALLWCAVYGRTDREAWSTPLLYHGDAWSMFAALKAAADGDVRPFLPLYVRALNAPFTANWNDYPNRQATLYWLGGLLARGLGIFIAGNLMLLAAHVLAGLSFYAAARYLRTRWEWAAAGALAYAFSPFIFWRGLQHLSLSLYWHLPLCVLVVGWCFRAPGLRLRSRRTVVAGLVTVVAGFSNIYYAALLAQFLVFAALAHLLRRRPERAAVPLVLLAVVTGGVLADNAGALAHRVAHGRNPQAVRRSYGDAERYALKPVELGIRPPGYGFLSWAFVGRRYWRSAVYRGEMGSGYLGLAGVAGLLWLGVAALGRFLRERRLALHSTPAALVWIFAFSIVGGLNAGAAVFGFNLLRATNRYSIWILTLILLAAVTRLSRAQRDQPRWRGVMAAGFVLLVALSDQLPAFASHHDVEATRRVVESDRAFVFALEASLPRGAMLFMLPVMDYPEVLRIHDLSDYEHFRPYLFGSHLRFSYGSDKGRPREAWQHRVEGLNPAAMVEALQRFGFDGIVLNRSGLEGGGETLLEGLRQAGARVSVESATGDLLFVRLRPDPHPALPEPG